MIQKLTVQDNDPDNIYYDLLITNIESSTTTTLPILQFIDNRNTNIINNAELYEVAILRFYLNTNGLGLPYFIPTCSNENGNTDTNQTIYGYQFTYVDLSGNLIIKNDNIIYQPQISNIPQPPTFNALGFNDNTSNYYSTYNPEYFMGLVNNQIAYGFNQLLVDLSNNNILAYNINNLQSVPQLSFNESSQLFSITAGSNLFTQFIPGGNPAGFLLPYPIFLSFNLPLMNLFFGLNAELNGIFNNYRLNNYWTFLFGNNVQSTAELTAGQRLTLTQSFNTVSTWSPVESVCFISNNLPVQNALISKPLVFTQGNILPSLSGQNSNFANIIQDIISTDFKPYLIYVPAAQFNWLSLKGNQAIQNIQIQVVWKDKLGQFNQLFLCNGGSCSLKLYFRKKKHILNKY